MAEIFRASTEGPDGAERTVAIKRILPERARNIEFMGMFLNEARIAATLHHPNVIEAYDFGSENGPYYLAMEYLGGRDTRRIVHGLARAGQKLPLEIAIAAAIGIATGCTTCTSGSTRTARSRQTLHVLVAVAPNEVVQRAVDVVGRRRANRFRSSTSSNARMSPTMAAL